MNLSKFSKRETFKAFKVIHGASLVVTKLKEIFAELASGKEFEIRHARPRFGGRGKKNLETSLQKA